LLWTDTQGTFFLLKGSATEFSEAEKVDVFAPEDAGGFHFVARKLFSPDEKYYYILASSSKKLVLLDAANLKLKEVFSDTETTISLSGVCNDIALFGSNIDGDGREEIINNANVYEWDGERFSLNYTLPHTGGHSQETVFADIDGDGSDELVTNDREHGGKQLKASRLQNGAWVEVPVITDETQTNEVFVLGDIDGDSTDEITAVVTGEDAVRLVIYKYHNEALVKVYSGNFTKPWRERQHSEQIKSVSYSDIDNDGKTEILVTTEDMIFDPLKPGYDVEYRYLLFAWKNGELAKLAKDEIIYPRVITGKSSFLIVNTVPDSGEKLRNIDKIYKKEELQVTEITYK